MFHNAVSQGDAGRSGTDNLRYVHRETKVCQRAKEPTLFIRASFFQVVTGKLSISGVIRAREEVFARGIVIEQSFANSQLEESRRSARAELQP